MRRHLQHPQMFQKSSSDLATCNGCPKGFRGTTDGDGRFFLDVGLMSTTQRKANLTLRMAQIVARRLNVHVFLVCCWTNLSVLVTSQTCRRVKTRKDGSDLGAQNKETHQNVLCCVLFVKFQNSISS